MRGSLRPFQSSWSDNGKGGTSIFNLMSQLEKQVQKVPHWATQLIRNLVAPRAHLCPESVVTSLGARPVVTRLSSQEEDSEAEVGVQGILLGEPPIKQRCLCFYTPD